MSAQHISRYTSYRMPDAAVAASRQLWLAGLGAAVVGSNWVRNEAGTAFRALLSEGSAVESRAMRVVQREVESSVQRAAAAWKGTRSGVMQTLGAITSAARQRLDRKSSAVQSRSVKPAATRRQGKAKRAAKRASTSRR